jgi:hypothetical protein
MITRPLCLVSCAWVARCPTGARLSQSRWSVQYRAERPICYGNSSTPTGMMAALRFDRRDHPYHHHCVRRLPKGSHGWRTGTVAFVDTAGVASPLVEVPAASVEDAAACLAISWAQRQADALRVALAARLADVVVYVAAGTLTATDRAYLAQLTCIMRTPARLVIVHNHATTRTLRALHTARDKVCTHAHIAMHACAGARKCSDTYRMLCQTCGMHVGWDGGQGCSV